VDVVDVVDVVSIGGVYSMLLTAAIFLKKNLEPLVLHLAGRLLENI
jgi:predicted thioredoxin/glutaredoxin